MIVLMKVLIASLVIIGLLFVTCGGIVWNSWWYPQAYEASLRLADDASLPEVKADYLQEYLDKVSEITGPPRYIFKRPDLDLEKQKVILAGLIQRFRDIAEIDPSEMAYQQGMEQLTGQEIDHQLDRISGIFKSAKLRQNFIVYLWACLWSWNLSSPN